VAQPGHGIANSIEIECASLQCGLASESANVSPSRFHGVQSDVDTGAEKQFHTIVLGAGEVGFESEQARRRSLIQLCGHAASGKDQRRGRMVAPLKPELGAQVAGTVPEEVVESKTAEPVSRLRQRESLFEPAEVEGAARDRDGSMVGAVCPDSELVEQVGGGGGEELAADFVAREARLFINVDWGSGEEGGYGGAGAGGTCADDGDTGFLADFAIPYAA